MSLTPKFEKEICQVADEMRQAILQKQQKTKEKEEKSFSKISAKYNDYLEKKITSFIKRNIDEGVYDNQGNIVNFEKKELNALTLHVSPHEFNILKQVLDEHQNPNHPTSLSPFISSHTLTEKKTMIEVGYDDSPLEFAEFAQEVISLMGLIFHKRPIKLELLLILNQDNLKSTIAKGEHQILNEDVSSKSIPSSIGKKTVL